MSEETEMAGEASVVTVNVADNIAWVSLNRPDKRNAMNPILNREMMGVLDALEFRDDVGILVLTGEGPAWSAGMDLKEYFREAEARGLGGTRQAQREAYGWWQRLRRFQKPTIAMVNGWCFGGAYGPLFACDLAYAADEAQFGLSEVNWGILPGGGAAKVAYDLMPFRKAMFHALTGQNIDGRTAAEWGLVNESVPLASLREHVEGVARLLLEKNGLTLTAIKKAMRKMGEMTFESAEEYLVLAQESLSFHDRQSRHEGIRQFIDEKSYKPGLGAFDKARSRDETAG